MYILRLIFSSWSVFWRFLFNPLGFIDWYRRKVRLLDHPFIKNLEPGDRMPCIRVVFEDATEAVAYCHDGISDESLEALKTQVTQTSFRTYTEKVYLKKVAGVVVETPLDDFTEEEAVEFRRFVKVLFSDKDFIKESLRTSAHSEALRRWRIRNG